MIAMGARYPAGDNILSTGIVKIAWFGVTTVTYKLPITTKTPASEPAFISHGREIRADAKKS